MPDLHKAVKFGEITSSTWAKLAMTTIHDRLNLPKRMQLCSQMFQQGDEVDAEAKGCEEPYQAQPQDNERAAPIRTGHQPLR
eukprot:1485396-Amphidinium_carterae.1